MQSVYSSICFGVVVPDEFLVTKADKEWQTDGVAIFYLTENVSGVWQGFEL